MFSDSLPPGCRRLSSVASDRAASGVAQHDKKSRTELLRRILCAAHLRRRSDVSGNADHEQVSKTLIENMLDGHPRICACQNHGEGRLTREQIFPLFPACGCFDMPNAVYEAAISFSQTFQGFNC